MQNDPCTRNAGAVCLVTFMGLRVKLAYIKVTQLQNVVG